MVQQHYGPETSYEERAMRRMQVLYSRKTRKQQVFMQDLKNFRKEKYKRMIKTIIDYIGPIWYQVLSVPQRKALDTLERSIYQDLLEGRPIRTSQIIRELGINPRPSNIDLMNCVYLGRKDPKEMFAQLYLMTYGYPIDGKQPTYCLNARLMLSSILYLGLDNLLTLLKERFRAEPQKKVRLPKIKPKIEPPLPSPYLQKMIAVMYEVPKKKRRRPPPLPNLDDLNEPYEEEPPIVKAPPLRPAPPPPPKKKLARSYCDKIAGVMTIEPYASVTTVTAKTVTRSSHRRMRGSKLCLTEVKKTYGISMSKGKNTRRRKPVAPSTGLWSLQYVICGVCYIHGKTVFILGNVSVLPANGDLIHGGYRSMAGENINVHCGFRGRPPPPKPDPCDCLKKYQDTVLRYIKTTKCYCGHYYDYGAEGTFPLDELPYFEKPTRKAPYRFNYQTIYDLDSKRLQVEKEFKRLWDTDSVLHEDDGTVKDDKKDKKKKKPRRSSTTCLGQNPKPEDYLKCALRLMRRLNIAARLPDVHLVPELKEWMRRRIHGPLTRVEKTGLMRHSNKFWQMLETMARRGYGHVSPSQDPQFAGHTTWIQKLDLNDRFKVFTAQYKLKFFRSQAKFTNMLWPTMCQAELPDKKFREIYFSYLYARAEDMQLMHPYSTKETVERAFNLRRRPYRCLPDGVEPKD